MNYCTVTTIIPTYYVGHRSHYLLLDISLFSSSLLFVFKSQYNKIYIQYKLAGFPFAGNTGFGAMAAHIPDDGYCLVVYGPHVGIAADGTVGKVERSGIYLIDTCCGSAVAASNYVDSITNGKRDISMQIQTFTDFQQNAVQELILPHGKRLADADIDGKRMIELPYALYDSQNMLLSEIVKSGSTGVKRGIALLGGIQINTGPDTPDYFHPLRFDYINFNGDTIDDLLPALTGVTDDDDDPLDLFER